MSEKGTSKCKGPEAGHAWCIQRSARRPVCLESRENEIAGNKVRNIWGGELTSNKPTGCDGTSGTFSHEMRIMGAF